jgi:hypothetical protein
MQRSIACHKVLVDFTSIHRPAGRLELIRTKWNMINISSSKCQFYFKILVTLLYTQCFEVKKMELAEE